MRCRQAHIAEGSANMTMNLLATAHKKTVDMVMSDTPQQAWPEILDKEVYRNCELNRRTHGSLSADTNRPDPINPYGPQNELPFSRGNAIGTNWTARAIELP